MKNILILNTGGTFNKIYEKTSGSLKILEDNKVIKKILKRSLIEHIDVEGLIYKDSLDFTNDDRQELSKKINNSKYEKIIVVHGTDTMDLSAIFVAKYLKKKTIVFTGSMTPFSIDSIEATSNISMAIGFLQAEPSPGVYISMHGMVKRHDKIRKNRLLGIFESKIGAILED